MVTKGNTSTGILGGLASSHLPDSNSESKQQSHLNSNAPLLSVLRRDSTAPTPTLQFESTNGLLDDLEDSDDDMPRSGEKRSGRRKIKIEYIEDKSRRHITFSKRKAGIMKKAYELSTLTGTQVLLLVASETGHVYTFATPKLQPLITKQEGKNLIQACLNSPDHHNSNVSEYLPATNSNTSHYETDLVEDDLTSRSASTSQIQPGHAGYLQTGTTPTSSGTNSAASVAAAAAQVFMNSGTQYNNSAFQQQSSSSGPYWNGQGNPTTALFAQVPGKSNVNHQQSQVQQSQQQQQQQQQMYHALLQQQQLYQQYQQQQIHKSSNDPNDPNDQ